MFGTLSDLVPDSRHLVALNFLEILDALNFLDTLGALNSLEILGALNSLEILGALNVLENLGALNYPEILGALNSLEILGALNFPRVPAHRSYLDSSYVVCFFSTLKNSGPLSSIRRSALGR